ncbi:MAG: LysR family transcriptional regulator [Desulfomonilaceae bacterium]
MELRHLRYFVAVAEELHFGRAANRVGIAQPPLSKQIRQLEDEIGVKLFKRTKRSVSLTHAGETFLKEAHQALELSERAVRSARRADRGEIGRLVVSFVGSATYSFLPSALRSFRTRFPHVELFLRELTTYQQLDGLHRKAVDAGVVRPPIKDDALFIETLLQEPFIVALPGGHALASRTSIPLQMLAPEGFVMFSRQQGTTFHDQVVSLCHQAGFSPNVVQEAVQIPTVLGLVSAGMGITLVPASIRKLQFAGVLYRDLAQVDRITELAMAYRRDDESPVLSAFLNVTRELAFQKHSRNTFFSAGLKGS